MGSAATDGRLRTCLRTLARHHNHVLGLRHPYAQRRNATLRLQRNTYAAKHNRKHSLMPHCAGPSFTQALRLRLPSVRACALSPYPAPAPRYTRRQRGSLWSRCLPTPIPSSRPAAPRQHRPHNNRCARRPLPCRTRHTTRMQPPPKARKRFLRPCRHHHAHASHDTPHPPCPPKPPTTSTS